MSSTVVELFGQTLLKGEESVETASALSGKTIGIYFSAHWCPPCRAFTPKLVEYYNTLKAQNKEFEIVFVSSDRDENQWKEYYNEMPWLAIPWANPKQVPPSPQAERISAIKAEFEVSGIPMLVLLKEDGSLITKSARDCIAADPEGQSFPYIPRALNEILPGELVDKNGQKYDAMTEIAGKKLGIYFSAHWCPPCRGFTPVLAELYTSFMNAGRGNEFEIIYVSGDSSEGEFNEYLSSMPWKALPFNDKKRIKELDRFFDVEGIPHLVILDEQLNVINDDGRNAVSADPKGENFPWPPKALSDLAEGTKSGGYDLNEKPSVIVFMESLDDEEQAEMEAMLLSIASEYFEEGKSLAKGPKYIFFTGKAPSRLSTRIRELTKVQDESKPSMVLINIRDKGAYYTFKGDDIDEASVRSFIDDFAKGDLEKSILR